MSQAPTSTVEALDGIASTLDGIHDELRRIADALHNPIPWNVSIK